MKALLPLLAVFVLALSANAQEAATQSQRQTAFVMFNQNVCPADGMERMMQLAEDRFAPVLNQMRAEQLIIDWGLLTHAWGDEYNFNWYIIAESHAAWVSAWDELIDRLDARFPGWFDQIRDACTLHKDNLYTLHFWPLTTP